MMILFTTLYIIETVILHSNKADRALHEEIFGPVISIYVAKSKEEAIEIENTNPYRNAASVLFVVEITLQFYLKIQKLHMQSKY